MTTTTLTPQQQPAHQARTPQAQHLATTIAVPTTMEEQMRFADMLSRSAMVPVALKGKPEEVFLIIQRGAECGLSPFAAVENITVINGRTTIWGDAMLALVKNSKCFQNITEEELPGDGTKDSDERGYRCTVTHVGQSPHTVTFTVGDAKKAGLWGKAGPWITYPKRMCQMRARGFALRDVFPHVLRGLVSTEEAMDMPTVGSSATKDDFTAPRAVVAQAAPVHEDALQEDMIIDSETGEKRPITKQDDEYYD